MKTLLETLDQLRLRYHALAGDRHDREAQFYLFKAGGVSDAMDVVEEWLEAERLLEESS